MEDTKIPRSQVAPMLRDALGEGLPEELAGPWVRGWRDVLESVDPPEETLSGHKLGMLYVLLPGNTLRTAVDAGQAVLGLLGFFAGAGDGVPIPEGAAGGGAILKGWKVVKRAMGAKLMDDPFQWAVMEAMQHEAPPGLTPEQISERMREALRLPPVEVLELLGRLGDMQWLDKPLVFGAEGRWYAPCLQDD